MTKRIMGMFVLLVLCGHVFAADTLPQSQIKSLARLADSETGNCVSIGTSSTQFTLPGAAGDMYCISAMGNTAYILCGSNPTATTSVNGFSLFVTSGATKCRRLTGPKCAYIGTTATGVLCFEHLNPSL